MDDTAVSQHPNADSFWRHLINRRSLLSQASLLALLGSQAMVAAQAQSEASTQPQALERVEITGTAVRRINAEASLPVQVITAAEIKLSGVNSVTELIQNLPSMQGFTSSSQSVNGGGGGLSTASIHGLGNNYTLVLLNGHRMVPHSRRGEPAPPTAPTADQPAPGRPHTELPRPA